MNYLKIKHIIWIVLFFLTAGLISEYLIQSGNIGKINSVAIQNLIFQKEQEIDAYIKELNTSLSQANEIEAEKFYRLYNEKGIAFYAFEKDSLVYWSNNNIPIKNYEILTSDRDIIRLQNGYYLVKTENYDNLRISGLLLIKYEYQYENNFLRNEFHKTFQFLEDSEISLNEKEGIQITSKDGEYLFSIIECEIGCHNTNYLFPFLLFVFSIICFFILLFKILKRYEPYSWILIPIFAIVLVLMKFITLSLSIPFSFYNSDLFNSTLYAYSNFIPSLGDLILVVLIVLFLVYVIKYFLFKEIANISSSLAWLKYLLVLAGFILFLLVENVISNLVFNSSISFEVFNVLKLSVYSILSYLVIFILVVSFLIFYDLIVRYFIFTSKIDHIIFTIYILSFLVFPLFNSEVFAYTSIVTFILLTFLYIYIQQSGQYSYSSILIIIFIITMYCTFHVSKISEKREFEKTKVYAVNLANEHDPVAEVLFIDLQKELEADSVMNEILYSEDFVYQNLFEYIERNHFEGFWKKYELIVTVCSPIDSLLIEPENTVEHCYDFFAQMINLEGEQIGNTSFYYLDNKNGRITYLGKIKYTFNNFETTLFIQLDSKFVGAQLGYPELLLDERLAKDKAFSDYSYAKYINKELISQVGDYAYSLDKQAYGNFSDEFVITNKNGFQHLIYTIDENNAIVVSKTQVTFYDYIIMFSYLFVFYFIIVTIVLVVFNKYYKILNYKFNLKNRIQILIISILFVSLFLIGTITVIYIVNQYKGNHYNNLSERIQSVLVELEHKIGQEEYLENIPKDYLTSLLVKFSNVFYTDINLYTVNGDLYASSREEIFNRGLTGRLIDPIAFYELEEENRAKFIHDEKIGELQFISAYVPFIGSNNNMLAYLNLPYFTKQNILQKEVSSFVITIINIYVLLILISLLLAVVLSNRLTKPLRLLQEKMRALAQNETYETIDYKSNDELGVLVNEYNRMVVELNKSIRLLARSEREMAWREMAKQIAHEIKNPLTPMKLSIQLLLKSWENKDHDFNERLRKVSNTLIEQINSLSAIATEFSAFAKMPRETFEEINLIEKIENSIHLFHESERIELNFNKPKENKIAVLGDKEQLLRVFNNLIKNAVQAIPNNQKGIIEILIEMEEKHVIVKIKDNGTGVKPELKEKLFEPNFTTKTSGMGLGLALVKGIIENMQGEIWFDTIEGNGSVFYVKLPVYNYK